MGDYYFFFVHPYNLKFFSKEKNDHYYPRILIKSPVVALDIKLNWFRKKKKKKKFWPSFSSTISFNSVNPVK